MAAGRARCVAGGSLIGSSTKPAGIMSFFQPQRLDQQRDFASLRRGHAFFLLLFLVAVIYANNYHCSWHFDDYGGVVKNSRLHLTALTPDALIQTFYAHPRPAKSGTLYRPLPNLTFALNWYLGKDDVVGYHVFNNLLHASCAFAVFLAVFAVLSCPNVRVEKGSSRYFIALLSAALWAADPIQIQAVTYIVQRMAAMAAMFYFLGIYFYIRGRLSVTLKKRIFLFCVCFVSFLLALGSKENAVTFPLTLIVVEMLFFGDLTDAQNRKRLLWLTIFVVAFLAGIALIYFKGNPFSAILQGYQARSFSLSERLLSAPRILLYYLSLIFYPIPGRLSITHDFTLSKSILTPWTTLPAFAIVLFLLTMAAVFYKRKPLFSFAVFFFFITQLVESTIIPLEIIFEHRNYLPSGFIFLPVAAGLKWLIDEFREKRLLHAALLMFIPALIFLFGFGTYVRNIDWATQKTLWSDAMRKAPRQARPYRNLAWGYYLKIGELNKAMQLYQISIDKETNNRFSNPKAYYNMAVIYTEQGDLEKAMRSVKQALAIDPNFKQAYFLTVTICLKAGDWENALLFSDHILSQWPQAANAYYLKGLALLKKNRIHEAIGCFRKTLKSNPNTVKALVNMGLAFMKLGQMGKSLLFLQKALSINPSDPLVLLSLLEHSTAVGNREKSEKYIDRFLGLKSALETIEYLKGLANDNMAPRLSYDRLLYEISTRFSMQAGELNKLMATSCIKTSP